MKSFRKYFRQFLILVLAFMGPCLARAAAPSLQMFSAYNDNTTLANTLGMMYLYTGNYPSTTFNVYSVGTPNTNILSGAVVANGIGVGPLQPAAVYGPFATSYADIESDHPMNGMVEDPINAIGVDQHTMVVAADTNNLIGTNFLTYLRANLTGAGADYGDDIAVYNPGSANITASVREWAGAVPGGAWGATIITSPSIPPQGVWMWSPSTASSANPNQSGGTLPAAAGHYRVDMNVGQGMLYQGDLFEPYAGSGTDRNDLAMQAGDRFTGQKVGTDLFGAADSHQFHNHITITNDGAAPANFTVYYFVPTAAGVQWPVSGLNPSGTWTVFTNVAAWPAGASFYIDNSIKQYNTFFRVVSTNGQPLNAWMGVGPVPNAFGSGDYMGSADLQEPWGALFQWGGLNDAYPGDGPVNLDVICPQNGITATYNGSGAATGAYATQIQTNTSGGPAALQFGITSSTTENYNASLSATAPVFAFALSQALEGAVAEALNAIPPPNLTQINLSKSVNVGTAAIGDTVTYTLVATNFSNSTMTACRVWDTLPSQVSFVSSTPANTTGPPPSNYYEWTLGSLAPQSSETITITATVSSGLNGQTVSNTAMADNSTVQPFTSSPADFVIVIPGANLQKVANVTSATAGSSVTYTLNYFNSSPAPAVEPHLDLQVEKESVDNTTIQYEFQIVNNSGAPVNMNDITVAYWLYDPLTISAITTNPSSDYGGNPNPWPGGGWTPPTMNMLITSVSPAITRPDNRDANMLVEWSTTNTQQLAAGTTLSGISLEIQTSFPNAFNTTDQSSFYYSRTTSTSYVSDPHFAIYYNGNLVSEYLNPTTPDPNTGVEPQNWVSVSDTVPTQMTYFSSSPSATVNGTTLSWFDPAVQPQTSASFTWTGTVNAGVSCTNIYNQADFTANTLVGVSNMTTITVACLTSPTNTPSITPTWTRTSTPTSTYTLTNSPSSTASPSNSPSPTPSFSFSPSPTSTQSATRTPSPTPTDSFSPTPSFSDTPSATASASATATYTVSPSFSATPSATASASPTPTATASNSFTATPSLTSTPTPSPSATQSNTFTGTPSFSATPSASPSATLSQTFTATPTPSASPSLSPTPTQSFSFTITPSYTPTPSASPSKTVTATFTVTWTFSVSPTYTPSPVPVPFQLSVVIYNEAGELVKTLFNGQSNVLPTSFSIPSPAFATSSNGVPISLPGTLSQNGVESTGGLLWNMSNDQGQVVQGGDYFVKLQYTDNFGRTTVFTQEVQVINTQSQSTLSIFNSAGELVWQENLPSASGLSIVNFQIVTPGNSNSFAPAFDANGQPQPQDKLQINLTASNSNSPPPPPIYWYGLNSQGSPVASGVYLMELKSTNAEGGSSLVTKSITVIESGDTMSLAGSVLGPNPTSPGTQEVIVSYPASPGVVGLAKIYSLNGELTALGEDPSSSGRIQISIGSLASGIYLVELVKENANLEKARTILKLAIIK